MTTYKPKRNNFQHLSEEHLERMLLTVEVALRIKREQEENLGVQTNCSQRADKEVCDE